MRGGPGRRFGTRGFGIRGPVLVAAASIAGALVAFAVIRSLSGTPRTSVQPSGAVVTGAIPTLGSPAVASSGSPMTPATASPVPAPSATTEPPLSASPPPTPNPPTVTLVGTGDIAECDSDWDTQTAALVDAIPGTVFTLGDNAYEDGTPAEFESCYGPTWGRFLGRTRPSPGNHEYNTPGAAGYFGYFGDRAGPAGRGYYAYDDGAWRIYSLNSNCGEIGGCGPGSAQLRWLEADLASNPGRCVLAYWHHPRYSSGEHGNQAFMDPIWDALYDAGAELVLAGHDHSYERFAAMNKSGDLALGKGITSFVVGTGGRDAYEFDQVLPASQARSTGVPGVLELTLAPDGWSSRFVPIAGERFTDEAEGGCH